MNFVLYKCENSPRPVFMLGTPYSVNMYEKNTLVEISKNLCERAGSHLFAFDLLGTGKSAGCVTNEYTDAEDEFFDQAIAFVHNQPFCNGQIYLIGISYSAFVALRAATRNKDKLILGVLSLYGGISNEHEDVFQMNGVSFMIDTTGYAMTQAAYTMLDNPYCFERLENHQFLVAVKRSPGGYRNIHSASFQTTADLVTGWSDTYVESNILLYNGNANSRLLIGPYEHGQTTKIMWEWCFNHTVVATIFFTVFKDGRLHGKKGIIKTHRPFRLVNSATVEPGKCRINCHRTPFVQTRFMYTQSYKPHDTALEYILQPVTMNTNFVCGAIYINLEFAGVHHPFMVYLFAVHNGLSFLVSKSIINPNWSGRWQRCTPGNAKLGDGKLYVAFDANVFPYAFGGSKKPFDCVIKKMCLQCHTNTFDEEEDVSWEMTNLEFTLDGNNQVTLLSDTETATMDTETLVEMCHYVKDKSYVNCTSKVKCVNGKMLYTTFTDVAFGGKMEKKTIDGEFSLLAKG